MRISEIVERFGGLCEGDTSVEVHSVTGSDLAGPGDTTFALNEKTLAQAEASGASCVIVPHGIRRSRATLVRCDSPQRYVTELMRFLHPESAPAPGIHPTAMIGAESSIAATASIGPYAVLGARCRVGPQAVLMASVVVGDDCEIGAGTTIHPHVSLYAKTRIGARVIIHAGTVIGADGFGYFSEGDKLYKWPHVGNVVIEDDVEIGANACIDRAKFGTTLVERGVKIDNLVQIAHNCRIGPGAILAGQTGLSGSVVVEAGAICGGQVGVADHHTIGRGARIAAQSGIINDVPPGVEMFGYPAKPHRQAMHEAAMLRYLTENRATLRRLIKAAGEK
ncbi:MAG: UDP-3-O-(3-hydroxymyristoyl)glucosamine N-acyltransferase [Planctomycetota bacterium]